MDPRRHSHDAGYPARLAATSRFDASAVTLADSVAVELRGMPTAVRVGMFGGWVILLAGRSLGAGHGGEAVRLEMPGSIG